MNQLSGLTEYSIFNILQSPNCTGFQYFKNYAISVVEEINIALYQQQAKNTFHLDFKTLFHFDGESYHEDGVDHVIINDGVVITTFEVFYNILSRYPILPYLSPTPAALGYNLIYNFNNEQYQTTINFPIDRERRIIAEYMAMFAIKFIILHEIGHHYNGHILYRDSLVQNITKLNTFTNNLAKSHKELLDLQTMEMDADAFAISRLIDETLILISNDTRLFSILKCVDDIYVIFIIAIQTLFLIFKKEQKTEEDHWYSPYFPTFPRGCINLDCAKTNIAFKAKGIITPDKFVELTNSSFIAAEKYFYSLYGVNHYQDAIDYEESMSAHIKEVEKNWVLLREKLIPFARVRLAQ